MTPRPDPLAVLREALAIAWPEGDHAEPHIYTEALDALRRVEAVIEAARELSRIEATGVLPDFLPLAAALAALDEGGET